MKVFEYLIYDDDLWSANQRKKNERNINVVALSQEEADSIIREKYPENGLGRDNWIFKRIICEVHYIGVFKNSGS